MCKDTHSCCLPVLSPHLQCSLLAGLWRREFMCPFSDQPPRLRARSPAGDCVAHSRAGTQHLRMSLESCSSRPGAMGTLQSRCRGCSMELPGTHPVLSQVTRLSLSDLNLCQLTTEDQGFPLHSMEEPFNKFLHEEARTPVSYTNPDSHFGLLTSKRSPIGHLLRHK
jgi:hypothetical protein